MHLNLEGSGFVQLTPYQLCAIKHIRSILSPSQQHRLRKKVVSKKINIFTFSSDGLVVHHRGCRDTQWLAIDFDVCVCAQVEPNSIAARDGRIKEGDRILQVSISILEAAAAGLIKNLTLL